MKNLFKNPLGWKLFIFFLVITLSLSQINQAQAGGVATWVVETVSKTLSTIQSSLHYYQCKYLDHDYIWGDSCGDGGGSGVPPTNQPTGTIPIFVSQSYSTTCNSVSLTYNIQNADQDKYGIYLGNNLVKEGNVKDLANINQINYTATGLASQTNYQYTLELINEKNEYFHSSLPEINAFTACLPPQCIFVADKEQVVFPTKINLSWNCQYADSCNISPGAISVNNINGTKEVTPIENTTYILTCQNSVGPSSFSAVIKVTNPKYKEVSP